MQTVALYSIKGGVGKTASAVNLAYGATQRGLRTLLVDLDPQCSSAFYFRIRPGKRIRKRDRKRLADRLGANIRESDYPGLDVLPSSLAYRNFDIMLDRMKRSKRQLGSLLETLAPDYDLAVLDSPPNITLLSENIFRAADLVLVPVIPTTLSRRTFAQLLDFFEASDLDARTLRPFFSMVQGRKRMHKTVMQEMRERFDTLLKTPIPFLSDVERMGLQRRPVLDFARKRTAGKAYRAFVAEVLELLDTSP